MGCCIPFYSNICRLSSLGLVRFHYFKAWVPWQNSRKAKRILQKLLHLEWSLMEPSKSSTIRCGLLLSIVMGWICLCCWLLWMAARCAENCDDWDTGCLLWTGLALGKPVHLAGLSSSSSRHQRASEAFTDVCICFGFSHSFDFSAIVFWFSLDTLIYLRLRWILIQLRSWFDLLLLILVLGAVPSFSISDLLYDPFLHNISTC